MDLARCEFSGVKIAYDLLFTDIGLPGGINGRQLADKARCTAPGSEGPVHQRLCAQCYRASGQTRSRRRSDLQAFHLGQLAVKIRQILNTRLVSDRSGKGNDEYPASYQQL